MSILDQLTQSNLSLDGSRGYSSRSFGFRPAPSPIGDKADATALHRDYSAFNNPSRVYVKDFNGTIFNRPASTLDETDPIAPNNTQAGTPGSVVSQIYKSSPGKNYDDLGPTGGHY
jgi:hypothetical protein